jgi:hypothetical protein
MKETLSFEKLGREQRKVKMNGNGLMADFGIRPQKSAKRK